MPAFQPAASTPPASIRAILPFGTSAGQSSVQGVNPIRKGVYMARYLDRAQMTVSGTPGTGPVTLNAAVTPNQTWAAAATAQGQPIAVGDVIWAVAQDSTGAWEIWPATITSTVGPVLSAPDVSDPRFQSSTGAAINLTSAATVFSDLPALVLGVNNAQTYAAFGGQG